MTKCHCGYYHYNIEQYNKIHGFGKKYIDPLVLAPFANDKLWNESDWDPTTPYPLITKKWVCQFCGFLQGHSNECSFFINYPEFF